MSIEAELSNLTLADVLHTCEHASPRSIREEEFPFLLTLCNCVREADRCNRPETERRWLKAAAVALRAIILTARRLPLPATERFLRETAAAEFGASILQEARACRAGGLAGFVAGGLEYVYPLLMWVAVVRGGDNSEGL